MTRSGKGKLLSMILRYINAAMERAHYEIIEDASEARFGSIWKRSFAPFCKRLIPFGGAPA